jgi:hypothetical protein
MHTLVSPVEGSLSWRVGGFSDRLPDCWMKPKRPIPMLDWEPCVTELSLYMLSTLRVLAGATTRKGETAMPFYIKGDVRIY